MKYRPVFFSLLAAVVSIPGALGQSQVSLLENPARIASARCAYAPAEECPARPDPGSATLKDETVAQIPSRTPGPPAGRPMGYPPAPYAARWAGRPSSGHVLIGALIGFGMGAAIAAKGRANAGGVLTLGAICGAIGGGIGASMPAFPPTYRYRGPWADYDEEARFKRPHIRPHRQNPTLAAAYAQSASHKPTSASAYSQNPKAKHP